MYCKAEKFGIEIGLLNLKLFSLENLAINNMIFCSDIYRKIHWSKLGGYDEEMRYGLEDWDFWISLLKDGGKVICLDYLGFYYRTKSDSMLK